MTLHLLRGRSWTIIFPPSGAYVTARRDCIIGVVRILLLELTYHQCYTLLPVVPLMQVPRVSPDTVSISEVLTYWGSACYSDFGTPPPPPRNIA